MDKTEKLVLLASIINDSSDTSYVNKLIDNLPSNVCDMETSLKVTYKQ